MDLSKNVTVVPKRASIFFNSKLRKIGIIFPGYGYERVSYALPVKEIEYRRVVSIPIHRLERKGTFYKNTPVILGQKVDLIHTWNAIPLSNIPFVVSFENEIPRYLGSVYKWQESLGLSILNSNRCLAILALSDIAAALAREKMLNLGYPGIADKIRVFRGGVDVSSLGEENEISAIDLKCKRPLKMLFIGGDLFRKGLVPAYMAIKNLIEKGANINLTVVGRFKEGGYVLRENSPSPLEWDKLLETSDWVTHYKSLPNKDVIKLMHDCDVLIFPSYDESLGWVIIEAALLGMPAITTNIFAIPELVKHNETGYVIDINLGRQNRWQGIWSHGTQLKAEIEVANENIREGVEKSISKLLNNPELIKIWGNAAKEYMNKLYNFERAANQLHDIYFNCLNKNN
ncbi:glycosyltransferase family 4 protein [Methylobacter luteus]|uniref:glycosyltransferase family 4 protein n=1 Tax=Methylobacter luteus TaxID=415 RepID=UPI0004251042|nr:glycosyltransferase family 4 protein [Methylobacter luteus]